MLPHEAVKSPTCTKEFSLVNPQFDLLLATVKHVYTLTHFINLKSFKQLTNFINLASLPEIEQSEALSLTGERGEGL